MREIRHNSNRSCFILKRSCKKIPHLKNDILFFYIRSEHLTSKFEQQKQKSEAEYTSRTAAEQRCHSLEQALTAQADKLDEATRKYSAEIKNVIFRKCLSY